MSAEAKLRQLGIDLPTPPQPIANYIGGVLVGNLLFMSGNGPRKSDGTAIVGKVGADLTIEQGYQAARVVGLGMLAGVRAQLGSLDKVKRIVRVTGMVNATPDFTEQARVIDGFSDLMVDVFGDNGRGARAAPGMGSLPKQVAVICDAIFEVHGT
jgi:enamine deaminase RidA (YjgF/YER057c/UK114 family)